MKIVVNLQLNILHKILQAKERDLSTGLKREAGRGDRVIVVGVGGEDGFVHTQVFERKRPKKNTIFSLGSFFQKKSSCFTFLSLLFSQAFELEEFGPFGQNRPGIA